MKRKKQKTAQKGQRQEGNAKEEENKEKDKQIVSLINTFKEDDTKGKIQ